MIILAMGTVCRSGARYGPITFLSRCGAKPGTRAVSLWTFPSLGIVLSSLYLMMMSRQVISTVFPSKGLTSNEHFGHTASTHFHLQVSYIEALEVIEAHICSWPNPLENTRRHRRHWHLCEHSSLSSSFLPSLQTLVIVVVLHKQATATFLQCR